MSAEVLSTQVIRQLLKRLIEAWQSGLYDELKANERPNLPNSLRNNINSAIKFFEYLSRNKPEKAGRRKLWLTLKKKETQSGIEALHGKK